MDRFRLLTFKHESLIISVNLRTAFAAETHLSEGQWLKAQLKVVKLRVFRVRTRIPTVSRTDGQYLIIIIIIIIIII
jgi:hypothetical protein